VHFISPEKNFRYIFLKLNYFIYYVDNRYDLHMADLVRHYAKCHISSNHLTVINFVKKFSAHNHFYINVHFSYKSLYHCSLLIHINRFILIVLLCVAVKYLDFKTINYSLIIDIFYVILKFLNK